MGHLILHRKLLQTGLALVALVAAEAAIAAPPLVRSRDGRLQATAVPGPAWCGEVVGLRLDGEPGVSERDPAFVQKFLTGVRAAAVAECPRATSVRFHLREHGQVVLRAYASKTSDWKIRLVPQVASPTSANSLPALDDAARREIAKIEAHFLSELAGAQHVAFLSDAEARTAHAAWRISNVSLGLTIRNVGKGQLITPQNVVEAITRQTSRACSKVEGVSFNGAEGKVASATFICREPPKSFAYGILVYTDGAQRHLIALKSSRADSDNGKNLMSVASAFERIIARDW